MWQRVQRSALRVGAALELTFRLDEVCIANGAGKVIMVKWMKSMIVMVLVVINVRVLV